MSNDRMAIELVEQAFELPTEERGAFLDRACAGSPGLRAVIDSLLRAVEEASGIGLLPETSAIGPDDTTRIVTSPPSGPDDAKIIRLSLAVGQQLAERYQVQRVIGVGGMDEVYHAIDQVLGRDVAIKVIRSPGLDDARLAERFDRELKSVALLSHPNVVTLYDVAGDGTSRFAVLEFVAGQSLQLNPSYAFARYNRALIDGMLSDAEASERNIEHAIRLSPIDPMSYAMQAMSYMLREDFEAAVACADQAIHHPAAHIHALATATIANQLAGNNQRATELADLIRQSQPDYGPADYFRSFPFRDSESARRMRSALQARLA